MTKEHIIEMFSDIMNDSGQGATIYSFITKKYGTEYLFEKLSKIGDKPITKVQLDQLLSLQKIGGVSDGFFRFYWLDKPDNHFYNINALTKSNVEFPNKQTISTLEQLKWGFYRIFVDSLYTHGNIQKGYEFLSKLSYEELEKYFEKYRINTDMIYNRGNTLHFENIEKKDRYLISEMACKTLANPKNKEEFIIRLIESYRNASSKGIFKPNIKDLLSGKYDETDSEIRQLSIFDNDDFGNQYVDSENDVRVKAEELAARFFDAHEKATKNTQLYLSLCNDLDFYVATSMRTKDDFEKMANFCEDIFKSSRLSNWDLRYFDPTMSAADSHEDKGLIECLMVKSARFLIYCAGIKDSYGKDAEAAMSLCMGKPTIFFCTEEGGKAEFFRNIHPLSRLIDFNTGVACGVIVCEKQAEVVETIERLLENKMEYQLEQKEKNSGYYLLKDRYTQSVVRVQTKDELLTSIFWNNYNVKH